jgi:ribA/ribD-fused uncharacterized protein
LPALRLRFFAPVSLSFDGKIPSRVRRPARPDPEITMAQSITFYHQDKPYGFFSNFSGHAIFVKGKQWPTSEHYFQAQKFEGTEHEELVRLAQTPMICARMGRDRSRPLRPDWEAVKDEVMRTAVRAKFTQHPELRDQLLATGDAYLIEHTKNDSYWGDGGDGSGKNMLGRILMEVREELRAATEQGAAPEANAAGSVAG